MYGSPTDLKRSGAVVIAESQDLCMNYRIETIEGGLTYLNISAPGSSLRSLTPSSPPSPLTQTA